MNGFVNYGNKFVSPCKDCSGHSETCHSICEKYISFKEELAAERERIHRAKEKAGLTLAHIKDVRKKQKAGSWKVDRRGTH